MHCRIFIINGTQGRVIFFPSRFIVLDWTFSYKFATIIYTFMLKKKKMKEMLFMLLSYFSILEFIKK